MIIYHIASAANCIWSSFLPKRLKTDFVCAEVIVYDWRLCFQTGAFDSFSFLFMVDRYLLHTFEACFHSTLRLKIRPNLSLVNKSLFWYNSLSNYIAFQSRCISSFASTQILLWGITYVCRVQIGLLQNANAQVLWLLETNHFLNYK